MTSIVSGEAVVLELRPATFASRGAGLLIDVLAQIVLLVALLLLVAPAAQGMDPAAARILILGLVILVLVIAPITVETLSRGRSLGKLALGLRIVRDDGGSIRFRHAVIRGLLAVVEILMTAGSLALLVSLVNERSKRLGDMVAGTYSVRERVPTRHRPLAETPPALAGWAELADLGRLPDSLARRVRQFQQNLLRLSPESRQRLGAALAAEAAVVVAPAPPPGTPPEDFLAAVMSERRRRDTNRLRAARERAETRATALHRLPY
ncbi:membrane protein [Tersicoccus solisilvae]|uniref:Membrane protein n=1 Tax=Tersicoccus solisilvae TaxID=1882339 RepID=A0ABQ1P9K2_9MICC|nr:RDD family protein [Tersicoccus solisilvae]GGC92776.1 membrane protein [Tersicoccus solisilvae]